jgi:MFS family permease
MDTSRRFFPAFYLRDYRLLWIGQVISFSGTWMHATAQGWLVYSLTRSPMYLGMVAAAASLPVMLFSLLGGVAADRFRKRNLLILTQALAALPALAIGALTQLGLIQIWQVVVFVAMLGTINAFDIPARQSFYVEIVGREQLLSAIALNSAAFNGARIIGPVAAGLTIAYVGLPACFYLNALSFLAVILALTRISTRGHVHRRQPRGLLSELLEGMRFIRQEPFIRTALMLIACFSLLGLPFVSLLPVFAEEVLDVGAQGLGFLAASAGLGAFLAAVALGLRGSAYGKLGFMRAVAVMFPLSLLGFSLSRHYLLSLALLAVAGWALVSFLAMANSTIQLHCTDAIRGRVMSVYTLVFLGMTPFGNAFMGTAAEHLGTPQAVGAAAGLCLLWAALLGGRLREPRG